MLTKVQITAYSDPQLKAKVGTWSAQINPETFTQAFQTLFSEDTGVDSASVLSRFKSQGLQTLTMDFVLDGTGVLEGRNDVAAEIAQFKRLAHDYNGKIHSQNYLEILWGKLSFKCMLETLRIDYRLFAPNGTPLRATLACSFKQHQTPEELAKRSNKKSADLTHAADVEPGVSLPLMCHRVYDDPAHYVAVARANALDTLADLTPGQRIVFPRLER